MPDRDASPLDFAAGSHRDRALSHWYTRAARAGGAAPRRRYPAACAAPLARGDATWHHGWLLHAAPPNFSGRPRRALAVSYVADGARLLGRRGVRMRPAGEDRESYAGWAAELPPRAVVRHPAVPLVYRDPDSEGPAAALDGGRAGGGGPGADGPGRKQRYFDLARDTGAGAMAPRRP